MIRFLKYAAAPQQPSCGPIGLGRRRGIQPLGTRGPAACHRCFACGSINRMVE